MPPDDPLKICDQTDPLLRGILNVIDWLDLLSGLLEVLFNW